MFGIDDAIVGAVGGSLVSGILNNESAQDRQDAANSFSAQQYATRYQTTVKDMEAAGLNPALAYGGISGSPPSGGIASSAGFPDLGGSVNAGRSSSAQANLASAQVANVAADTENKKAQADLIAAQAAAAWSSAGQSNANIGLINANVQKVIEETRNIPYEGNRIRAAAEELLTQADLNFQKGSTEQAVRSQIAATVAKLRSETSLLNNQVDVEKALNNFGRGAGQVTPAAKVVIDVLRSMKGGK